MNIFLLVTVKLFVSRMCLLMLHLLYVSPSMFIWEISIFVRKFPVIGGGGEVWQNLLKKFEDPMQLKKFPTPLDTIFWILFWKKVKKVQKSTKKVVKSKGDFLWKVVTTYSKLYFSYLWQVKKVQKSTKSKWYIFLMIRGHGFMNPHLSRMISPGGNERKW